MSCNTNDTQEEVLIIPEEELIIPEFSFEINEISEHDLFHCCCDKEIKNLVKLLSVKVSYINMNGESEMGELVVNEEIAAEVVDIFREIYQCRFPINKMIPIDFYNCNDDKSMEDNNTSCFNYRLVSGSRKLSDHSFGKAIDINPLFNPFVKRKKVSPENGKMYIDRNLEEEGMIQKNDCVVNAFKSRGWYWGGNWKHSKDYQHFYKY
ncbi:MAG: M15 family metallopeptidase [Flavobacteriales bacterium]|nr:M15 family metallopeptidase [Flavobacteriales bacterium]